MEKDMTAAELAEIIRCEDFRAGLEEMSSYLASIMQETPLAHLLAKCLWKEKHQYVLERGNKKHDLTIWPPGDESGKSSTTIEVKQNYDCAMETLSGQLRKYEDRSLSELWEESQASRRSIGWDIPMGFYKDMVIKAPSIFLLILCSRDLSRLDDDTRARVVWSEAQCKYNEEFPYHDRAFLGVFEELLTRLQVERPFTVVPAEIEVHSDFPSTYHFRICEFQKATGSPSAPARQEPRPPDNASRPIESQVQE
jgi:hypothetical protein